MVQGESWSPTNTSSPSPLYCVPGRDPYWPNVGLMPTALGQCWTNMTSYDVHVSGIIIQTITTVMWPYKQKIAGLDVEQIWTIAVQL